MARKIPDGEKRNRARTMRKLMGSVSNILANEGFRELGVNHIASVAEVSKRLIYAYFDSKERLVRLTLTEKDYWTPMGRDVQKLITAHEYTHGRELAIGLLKNLRKELIRKPEMLDHLLWEISEHSEEMAAISAAREHAGKTLLRLTEPVFRDTSIDFEAIYAALLGGSYYVSLRERANDGAFCGLDTRGEPGQHRLAESLETVIRLCYRHAGLKRLRQGRSLPRSRSIVSQQRLLPKKTCPKPAVVDKRPPCPIMTSMPFTINRRQLWSKR